MFEIVRYTADKATEWNQFVAQSKNGTFLFDRQYMDYHSDRFADYSLMFYRQGRLYALLPANQEGDTLCSHRGLTYGGLIMDGNSTAARTQQLFREMNEYLRQEGFRRVIYKPVPHIFHQIPSEEDLYALFSICDAHLIDRSLSSTIDLAKPQKWHRDRKYGAHKALANGIVIGESDDWAGFWDVLEYNLKAKYDARPVHTLEEIRLLHERFPQQMRLFTASKDSKIVGGTVLYLTSTVVHTQYISADAEGKQWRVIDALFDYLLHECDWQRRYFDFGTSNEEDGKILVEPLIYQKEGFGGRGICYDWYEWTL
ncbi:MAG: GNAT family N-acetyltransferase [Prevotella sp.]|nr:GNAT family N-acetyltransferase [Prevotella sp.]